MEPQADIALIGLAVMGQNLILNMNDHGFTVVAYNRTVSKVDDFLNAEAKGTKIIGAHSLAGMAALLKRPRRVMLMVKAGKPVDEFIEQLLEVLEPGDIIIDGGNSLFDDTIRRTKYVESRGLLYVGTGVSGGEEGARNGPSIMPGGSQAAWEHVKPIFQAIAAKVDDKVPCCDWVGEDGAGHYVKMTHNGIEYGDMQLICEAYHLMKDGLGLTPDEMHEVFKDWNTGELDSYLIEITRDILAKKDTDGAPLVDKILDTAGQKGTGKWTVISSADMGIPITLIAEAVYSRCVSAMKDQRVAASKVFKGAKPKFAGERTQWIADIRRALYASKIISYAQGYMLMRAAAK
ncbi:MAG: decarboxylating NADP(+)-dependent phosphogluconate dehydrogenase, partial [Betaproteobacteria bacterium]